MATLSEGYTVTNAAGPPFDPSLPHRDNAAIAEMEALREQPSNQDYCKPAAERAANGKALINFLMQDKFFLDLYRSNDARTRAAAIDKLNNAHNQAYGDLLGVKRLCAETEPMTGFDPQKTC
ncbi:MAG: hypothetical protein WAN43_18620 [Rhodomicrobium sp.]